MITKAALLLFRHYNGNQELLFARPKTRSYFVFPGGKQEKGEAISTSSLPEAPFLPTTAMTA